MLPQPSAAVATFDTAGEALGLGAGTPLAGDLVLEPGPTDATADKTGELPHQASALEDNEQRHQLPEHTTGEALINHLFVRPMPPVLQQSEAQPVQPAQTMNTPPVPAPSSSPPKRQRRRRVFDMSSEFLAMFQGPLPEYIVAALTAAFHLDDDGAEELDEALAAVAGEAIEDLQEEPASANIHGHAQVASA
ncbi:unnamed protein product [Urochloa humidicola]